MSFLSSISSGISLRPTKTRVTNSLGQTHVERKNAAGEFETLKVLKQKTAGPFMVIDNSPDSGLHSPISNIFISSQDGAANLAELRSNSISHILNVATGIRCHFRDEFTYLKIKILDLPEENILQHFLAGINFIDRAIKNNGKVLVHW